MELNLTADEFEMIKLKTENEDNDDGTQNKFVKDTEAESDNLGSAWIPNLVEDEEETVSKMT